jgi:UPF0716 protein FxsA
MPLYLLLLLFIGIPIMEFWLMFEIGTTYIGFWGTVAVIVTTGFIGSNLARREGLKTLENARLAAANGQVPTDAMIDGLLILLAGGMLLTPGYVTDACGFLLLIPAVRARARNGLKNWFSRRVSTIHIATGGMPPHMGPFGPPPESYTDTDTVWREAPEDPTRRKPDILITPKSVDDRD